MRRFAFVIVAALFSPAFAFAATFSGGQTVVVSEPPSGNTYLAGAGVSVTAPVPADLTALGASVGVSGAVSGDALIAGGDVSVYQPVAGDVRIIAGRAVVRDSVGGDLVAAAATFLDTGSGAKDIFVIGGSVSLEGGAAGPVTIYGTDVFLAGTYAGDVHVTASNRLTLGEGTHIKGTLYYDAPQEASVPASAVIDGGAKYTGRSYLPTAAEAHAFLAAGIGVFFLVKVFAALIAAALIVGLFPLLAQGITDDAIARSPRHSLLLILLGFAVLVATPVLLVLLSLTLVGLGLVFLIGTAYLLALLLAYGYAAALTGSILARRIVHRDTVLWRDAVFGVLVLSVIGVVPFIGWLACMLIFALALGSLVSRVYHFAFRERDEELAAMELP
ncbi:MAG: hypothetical protein KGI41_03035 [Patescibacteria group bacterium]|nr:hypothetical protein [Patescibacteria group bacterium]MDE1966189.1 hypothetical protein [Patescibacteria group bacterium]